MFFTNKIHQILILPIILLLQIGKSGFFNIKKKNNKECRHFKALLNLKFSEIQQKITVFIFMNAKKILFWILSISLRSCQTIIPGDELGIKRSEI